MKPAHVWSVFGVCLAALLAALLWSTATVRRLEQAELQARAQAALEENTRLALWRLDSALMPLLAQESARPSSHYQPDPPQVSPLLRETPREVLLHFQIAPGGRITSPQVPGPPRRAPVPPDDPGVRLVALRAALAGADLVPRLPREPPPLAGGERPDVPKDRPPPVLANAASSQSAKNVQEFMARQQTLELSNNTILQSRVPAAGRLEQQLPRPASPREGSLTPLWVGDTLVLARRVGVSEAVYVQGCWLDWPALRRDLLAAVQDLLPGARLEPAAAAARPDQERRLATLPLRLVPGVLSVPAPEGLSPTRLSLAGVWACALLAAVAVAALLRGVMELSERRRVFVSAVTHELRTPLTTFRLYTDMLAEDMVPDEEKRRAYVSRLRSEAERLGHLVENVLFYARVESGRAVATRESVDLRALLEDVGPRLAERAARAGLELLWESRPQAPVRVWVDRSAVEQVLLNLVDNACKYAAASAPPRIEVDLEATDGRALVRVSDHGPGISAAGRRRLFRPFSKSDREAANSAPGIGLGLALSRRLARAQGGDLRLEASGAQGSAFVLILPLVAGV
jgi:signal transduction histidine kinase